MKTSLSSIAEGREVKVPCREGSHRQPECPTCNGVRRTRVTAMAWPPEPRRGRVRPAETATATARKERQVDGANTDLQIWTWRDGTTRKLESRHVEDERHFLHF